MITKNECLLLLTELQDKGEDVDSKIKELISSPSVPIETIKFLNDHRQLDVAAFYEKLRVNYNHKKSNLYKNLVKEEFDSPEEALTTLASLCLQILLYSKNVTNKPLFLTHSRLKEITDVLNKYTIDYDLRPCLTLLYLIKSDLKGLESTK